MHKNILNIYIYIYSYKLTNIETVVYNKTENKNTDYGKR